MTDNSKIFHEHAGTRKEDLPPALQEAKRVVSKMQLSPKGTRRIPFGAEQEAFGDQLQDPVFKKKLRKLQNDLNISSFA